MQMYGFHRYLGEAVAGRIDNYVAVSHAGHGVNSYAINYHLVYGRVALFVQLGWGGIYMDQGERAQTIAETFAKCGEVLEAAAGVDAFERGRLVIAQSLGGMNVCSWLSEPTGDLETARRWLSDHARGDPPALESAVVWLANRAAALQSEASPIPGM